MCPLLEMPLIVQRVAIENKSWAGMFRSSQIKIDIEGQELTVYPAEFINFVLDLQRRITISITRGGPGYKGTHLLDPGLNTIDFDTEEYSGSIQIIYTENIWRYLDGDIGSPGTFMGRPYTFNKYTFETSFEDRAGMRLRKFPSFVAVQLERCYYADTDNKIVTLEHPRTKRARLKENLRKFFKTQKRMPFTEVIHFPIDRKDALQSGALVLMRNIRNLTATTLAFSFENEIGEDYGAVRREFFYIVFQEMLEDKRLVCTDGTYDVAEDNSCSEFLYDLQGDSFRYDVVEDIAENYCSVKNSEMFYTFIGVLFGCFLHFGETVNVRFSLAFYEALLGGIYTIRHIQDTVYQRSLLRYIREDAAEFNEEDAHCAVLEKLYTRKANAYAYIKAGFRAVIPADLCLHEFTAFDFPFIFLMPETLTVECIRSHAAYEGCNQDTQEIIWLWEILLKKDTAYLRCFLQFFTGSGNLERFDEECVFWIIYKPKEISPFFRASSCARRLEFGAYSSIERMEYYMDYSIFNTEGFHKA